MPKNDISKRRPTRAELQLLRILWNRGPSTVREIHETLPDARQTGYTTVLKLLQIMYDKGIVDRDESERAHVYSAIKGKEQTQRQLLRDFLSNVYEGSAAQLALQALGNAKPADKEELESIRKKLDELEHGGQ